MPDRNNALHLVAAVEAVVVVRRNYVVCMHACTHHVHKFGMKKAKNSDCLESAPARWAAFDNRRSHVLVADFHPGGLSWHYQSN